MTYFAPACPFTGRSAVYRAVKGQPRIPVHLVHQAPVPKTSLRDVTKHSCHLHSARAQQLWRSCHEVKGICLGLRGSTLPALYLKLLLLGTGWGGRVRDSAQSKVVWHHCGCEDSPEV